ncbi:hypothetical protein H4R19_003500, partial [Coemansia spiralis]
NQPDDINSGPNDSRPRRHSRPDNIYGGPDDSHGGPDNSHGGPGDYLPNDINGGPDDDQPDITCRGRPDPTKICPATYTVAPTTTGLTTPRIVTIVAAL